MNISELHERALEAATRYRKAEGELIGILQQAEDRRVFLAKGHSSLFLYVVKGLGLSDSVAYNLISVARKAREVPELKAEIAAGAITLSNARKIVPVLNRENKAEWLEKARTLSQRRLEKEVVKVRPQEATPEKVSYVTESRVKLQLGLSEKDILKLRRVQDLFCQAKKRPVSLEEVLVSLTDDFLRRSDPVEKAKRQIARAGLPEIRKRSGADRSSADKGHRGISDADFVVSDATMKRENGKIPSEPVKTPVSLPTDASKKTSKGTTMKVVANVETAMKIATGAETTPDCARIGHVREPIPARILHSVNFRDEGRCQFTNDAGDRCGQTRWTEVHHITPISRGGANTTENLRTLCSAHHKWVHAFEESPDSVHSGRSAVQPAFSIATLAASTEARSTRSTTQSPPCAPEPLHPNTPGSFESAAIVFEKLSGASLAFVSSA